ncbi:glycine--tRNA ligase subunit beta [Sphingomonas sp. CGMCC 1.13654]|uniref:Glycine--tRNA ligase beta subunit n=1 Tax=Sphingomonas chungangi TaxID=2683589 RepID=A0A838L9J5_9SPHN|nr:glycine--tRNA ligase subunit beta [Sphingomonas chungangi]MBA2935854.1 glycine--tRNA ligase subunit beta [Sphingomonas chungangi]MVW54545.1 glycine--tRNA ligase subunit beta [Sphingomonas chungangi]
MTDFLLELLSEEIPARMQEKASADLARLFEAELAKSGLKADAIESFVTPRRLALIARGLPAATEAVSEELKGPRADAPEQALAGFLGKTGLTRDQLVEREDAKGNKVLFAVIEKPGRPTAEVLAEAIPAIVRAFPWPKSMRWGEASLSTESLRWVRPLQGIVALFGEDVVPFAIAGVASGATTVGHRFHHPDVVTIGSAADYACKLRACHVIVDSEERRRIVREGAEAAAAAEGLALVPDEGLVAENAGLTEWPVPLLGHFDPAFLEVPREVIQLTMRTNQKYFACTDGAGALAPAFVCTGNIVATDGGVKIVEGNAKVLAARLSDARFFWEQDLKVPLESQAKKLDQIVFHEKLGTVADKVERVAKLARWLVEEGIVKGASTDEAEQAARLAKADLVTGMVGEFPELQGVMGGYYARAEGLRDAVADAIRDHYKPVGQGDDVPTAPVTVAVSLADKLDTLIAFFYADMPPTGSKDPFALRRAALGVLELVTRNDLRLDLSEWISRGLRGLTDLRCSPEMPDDQFDAHNKAMKATFASLPAFFADRLKVQQREAGVRHDLIDAVFALGGEDDLVRLLARVKALQAFVETEEGANLLAGYRRAANILRAEAKKGTEAQPFAGFAYTPDAAEAKLAEVLDAQLPIAEAAIETEDFAGAMTALSVIRPAIDRFFDDVIVNSEEQAKRTTRLALLEKLRAAMHKIADFSKIEG